MKRKGLIKSLGVLVALALTVTLANVAMAGYIVNTGDGPDTDMGNTLDYFNWYAVQFTLDSDTTIGSLEAWMGAATNSGDPTVAAALYLDGPASPGPQLGIWNFEVPIPDSDYWVGWAGVSDLNLSLTAGTYWLAFQVFGGPGDSFNGYLPWVPDYPPTGYNYAWSYGLMNWWFDQPPGVADFGFRIGDASSDPNAVPIPGAVWLLGSGLLGLFGIGRKMRS